MEDVEIYTRHQVFRPRAMLSVGLSVTAVLPTLYLYLLLGNIDLLHPLQSITGLFGTFLSAVLYWLLIAAVLFCALAYRITYCKVTNERLYAAIDRISLVFTRRSLFLAVLHGVSSFLIACVLTSMIGGRYSDLIIECHSHRCLNEQKWFIVLFSSIIGFVFSIEMSSSGGYSLNFHNTEKAVMQKLKDELPSLVKSSTRTVRRSSIIYYPAYILIGSTTSWIFRACMFLDDDPHIGLKSWWSVLDLTLLYQMYIAAVFIRLTWAVGLFLFQACITKRAKFELLELRSGGSLLSALQLKQDNLTKMLAFKDLSILSSTYEDERRQTIFSLSMPGGHPKAWTTILLVTKGCLTDLLQRLEAANDKLLSTQKGVISHQASRIETIKPGFHRPQTSAKQAPGSSWYHPSIIYKHYSDSLAAEMFYDVQKHIWSLTALSSLITRSVTEDKYGIVQQNMGEIIALLLNIHQAVENLFKMAPVLSKMADKEMVNKNSQLLGIELQKELRLALESIATTFQLHISHISGLNSNQKKQLCSFAR